MTTRDQARRVAGDLRVEACGQVGGFRPLPRCPSACTRRASARASTCTAPSATRRSGRATWRPRARRMARAAGRGLHEGLPPQLRAVPRARPRGRPRPVEAGARRRRPGRAGHRRPAADPGAAPGDHVQPGRHRRGAAHVLVAAFVVYLGVQLVRFAKPPTIAVTDPGRRRARGRRRTQRLRPRGAPRSRAPRSPFRAPVRSEPIPRDGRTDRRLDGDGATLRRGKNQFEITAMDPETGKPRSRRRRCSSPCRSSSSRHRRSRSISRPRAATFENGAIPVGGHGRRMRRRSS